MNCHGGLVQVALEIKAGLANELLVLGLALGRRRVAERGQAVNVAEVQVDDGVAFRQQAGGLGRGVAARQDQEHNGCGYRGHGD